MGERRKSMDFGEKLQKLRKERKMSQEQLAEQINVSFENLTNLYNTIVNWL